MVSRPPRLLRLFAALLAALSVLPAPIALARSGNAPAHDEAGADRDSDAGQGGNGGSSAGNGHGSANGNGSGGPTVPGSPKGAPEISDEDRALGAVSARVALPLTSILALALAQNGGEFIDAELIVVDGGLVYDVTLLDAAGRLTHLYYAARTGRPVAH